MARGRPERRPSRARRPQRRRRRRRGPSAPPPRPSATSAAARPSPTREHVDAPSASIPEAAARDDMIAETPEPDIAEPDAASPRRRRRARRRARAQRELDGARRRLMRSRITALPRFRRCTTRTRSSAAASWAGSSGWSCWWSPPPPPFISSRPPELKARAGIAEVGESPLQLMLTTSDRQKLASGNELLAISGRVINSTDRVQAVPPIHAELRDPASNRLVYQWTIAPPARSLAPGAARASTVPKSMSRRAAKACRCASPADHSKS